MKIWIHNMMEHRKTIICQFKALDNFRFGSWDTEFDVRLMTLSYRSTKEYQVLAKLKNLLKIYLNNLSELKKTMNFSQKTQNVSHTKLQLVWKLLLFGTRISNRPALNGIINCKKVKKKGQTKNTTQILFQFEIQPQEQNLISLLKDTIVQNYWIHSMMEHRKTIILSFLANKIFNNWKLMNFINNDLN